MNRRPGPTTLVAPLRVLLVEDSPADARLVLHNLRGTGREIVSERVENGAELRAELGRQAWDIVISDWSLPSFTALDSVAMLRELGLDIPLIIVSGTIGEERAVEAMRAGARDYVGKDNLARLTPAVERELREAGERRARRKAEAEVQRQQARFRALIEHGGDVIGVVAASGEVRFASPATLSVLGREPHELVGRAVFEWAHVDEREAWRALLARVQAVPGMGESLEFRTVLPDGTSRWVLASASNRLDEPAIDGMVVHVRDVDARRRAADDLRAAEARYRRIVETTSEGVWVLDDGGRTTFVNGRMAQILGRPAGEIIGSSALEFMDGESRATGIKHFGGPGGEAIQREVGLVRPDGGEVRALFEVTPIVDEAGRFAGLLGMARDVTAERRIEDEKRRAEEALARSDEQLRHAQKMEAVGRLAGGVAHDFNNLLSVILSYGTMLLEDLQDDETKAADLAEICNAGRRAADLTQQLLAFSRQQVIEPKVINLNGILDSMERMCRRILGEDIELVVLLGKGLGKVLMDPGAFEQVIMNLLVNSRDAMPRGGKLTVETSNVTLDEEFVNSHLGVKAGPHVLLSVSDTGCGMDANTMQRVFEPFFTTKEVGKGTGLGLSTVFGIVRQAGGTIWVYSEVGLGTTFRVLLPIAEQAGSVRRRPGFIAQLSGTETVLVVEDDTAVRGVARGILKRNGYVVIEASGPADAIALANQYQARIDLLLTDIVMPGMSGPDLAIALQKLRPQLKVLCMSGYTDEAVVRHGLLDSDLAFLQKPLLPEVLLRKVRETLESV